MSNDTHTFSAVVIPVDPTAPVYRVEIGGGELDTLAHLQDIVGGMVQVLPYPDEDVSVWINEEGKYRCLYEDGSVEINPRATLLMKPGVGIFHGDYIAGPAILSGGTDGEGNSLGLPEGWETGGKFVQCALSSKPSEILAAALAWEAATAPGVTV